MYFVPVDELVGGAVLGSTALFLPGYSTPQKVVVPAAGATVHVYNRGTTVHANVYESQSGSGSPAAQPLTTNTDGQVVDGAQNPVFVGMPQELDIVLSGGGLTAPKTIQIGYSADPTLTPSRAQIIASGLTPADIGAESTGALAALEGVANGLATLDSTGKVPVGQIPTVGATGGLATAQIGDGASTSFLVNHGLGSQYVEVTLINNSTLQEEECSVVFTDANHITLSAEAWTSSPPALNAYTVRIAGNPQVFIGPLGRGAANGVGSLDAGGHQPLTELNPGVVTDARGVADQDILVRSGGTWARLAVGSSDQLLVVRSDGTIGWIDAPVVHAGAWGLSVSNSAALNTTNLQAAANQAKAKHATLEIPFGNFPYNGISVQDATGFAIRGANRWGSILTVAGNNNIGLNFFSNTGTGGIKGVSIADLQVNYSGTNTTALRLWNVQSFSVDRSVFYSDQLAVSMQGSFNGRWSDSAGYITGNNAAQIAALWVGSGKTAPHTGATTLSGCGAINFEGGSIFECNTATGSGCPAVIVEDNTRPLKFSGVQWSSVGGAFPAVMQIDGTSVQVDIEDCYQEGSYNATSTATDIAIGVQEATGGYVTIKRYNSTGAGNGTNKQAYCYDVKSASRLRIEDGNNINYVSGSVHLRASSVPTGSDDRQMSISGLDNGAASGTPIYVDDDARVSSTYRGPIVRTNAWKPLLIRSARFDASVVTAAGTYLLDMTSDPTASGTSDPNSGLAWVYIDPADYGYSALRVRMSVMTNATAPGATIAGGLVASSGNPAGGAAAVTQANGGFVMGSASVATPALSTKTAAVSSTGFITTAGWYALAVSPSGAFAANSSVAVTLRLEALA